MQMYQPPQSYMDKYNNNPSVFNNEYQKYVQHLNSSEDEDGT